MKVSNYFGRVRINHNTNSYILFYSLCHVFVHIYIHMCDYDRDPYIRILVIFICIRAIVYLCACTCSCVCVIGIAGIASENTKVEQTS